MIAPRTSIVTIAVVGVLLATGTTQAGQLGFSFTDTVGDGLGHVDLVRMDFTFDNSSGSYTAKLFADPANPFSGAFRLNINIFNADTGTLDVNPSFFQDAMNDLSGVSPTTELVLDGLNTNLKAWNAGDRVAVTGPWPIGVPWGITSFGAGVVDMPWVGVYDNLDPANPGYTEISLIPEAATYALVAALGLVGFAAFRRFRA